MRILGALCGLALLTSARGDSDENSSSEEDDCDCVPFHRCRNNQLGYDGTGKIQFRLEADTLNSCPTFSLRRCCSKSHSSLIDAPKTPATRKGCGRRNAQGIEYKIVDDGGKAAQFGEFPWMAMVYMTYVDNSKEITVPICGGALIHEKVVLTAAHCSDKLTKLSDLHRLQNVQSWVRLGEWDLQTVTETSPHQDLKVSQAIKHENYDADHLYNDIALLVLERNATFANHVDIVCLPNANDVIVNSMCAAAGWGKNVTGNYQHVLKKVEVPMVPRHECQEQLRTMPNFGNLLLHESFVCAGGIEGKDTCQGDGGGPLVCPIPGDPNRHQQAGIVAWGFDCGKALPSVYVDVARFRPWIDAKMAGLGFKPEYGYS